MGDLLDRSLAVGGGGGRCSRKEAKIKEVRLEGASEDSLFESIFCLLSLFEQGIHDMDPHGLFVALSIVKIRPNFDTLTMEMPKQTVLCRIYRVSVLKNAFFMKLFSVHMWFADYVTTVLVVLVHATLAWKACASPSLTV